MIVELSSAGVETRGTGSLTDRTGATLHYPAECESWLGLGVGLSVEAAERRCFLRRVPTLVVTGDEASICADYMGMRHLYLYERREAGALRVTVADDPFAFKGLLAPDLDALRLVPALKFVPLPLSCIRGTTRLPPATRRTYSLRPVSVRGERSLLADAFAPEPDAPDIARVLRDIVDDHLDGSATSHVFLSGGMDSALLTYLLRSKGRHVQAWTARFGSSLGRIESDRAMASARFLGANINVVDVDQGGAAGVDAILDHMREPFADVATVAEAVLARRAAAGGARAAFEGEGVDSLMCGSYKFVVERYRLALHAATSLVPDLALARVGRRTTLDRVRLKVKQMKQLAHAPGSDFERHLAFLVRPDAWSRVADSLRERAIASFREYYDLFPGTDRLNRLAAMTFWGNIPNLENRKLDLVERCSGVRLDLPYGKWCMRNAFRGRLPPHVLTRKKISFVPPVLDLLGPEHESTLHDSSVFADGSAEQLLREHRAGRADHLASLWAMFVTNRWLRRYRGT